VRDFIRALGPLIALVHQPRWVVPSVIVFGLLAALSEGLSISLFIPLIQHVANSGASGAETLLLAPFERITATWRIPAICAAILACMAMKNILSYANSCLFSWANGSVSHQLRSGILRQLLSVSQSWLDTQDTGRLMNTLGTDTWRASWALRTLVGMLINSCMILIFSVLLLIISWKLTLVTALALLVIAGINRYLTKKARHLGADAHTANQSASLRMVEIFSGMRIIRAYGREPHEQFHYDEASQEIRRTFFKMDKMSALVGPVSETLVTALLITILLFSIQSPATLATSVTFLLFLYRLHPRVRQIESDNVTLKTLTPALKELAGVMSRDGKTYLRAGSKRLPGLGHEIEFDNITLWYGSAKTPALEEVTFAIPIGCTTALVGPSGAGKSSVISLLCRLYDPTTGSIRMNGVPLAELDLTWWRDQIALVSQDVHIFNATVSANIAYGKLDATPSEILAAARHAHALSFIEALPQGFDTVLGDHGFRLSGGQRQRLALSRALVRDPQILILDEASNALDSISERLMQDTLESFGQDRTVVIIAHRLSTIEHASHVIVLESGRVVEQGPPSALRAAGGLFAELHALQFSHAQPRRCPVNPSTP